VGKPVFFPSPFSHSPFPRPYTHRTSSRNKLSACQPQA
jgi:hypothetical protein